jgi:hypothetical protein
MRNVDQFEWVDCPYHDVDKGMRIEPGLHFKKKKFPPELEGAIRDLAAVKEGANHDLVNVSMGNQAPEESPSGFSILSSMMEQLGKNEEIEAFMPLSIPESAEGLGKSGLQVPTWIKGPTDNWKTAISLPGTVTNTHRDYWLVGQVIQHIKGKKLWLVWPPQKDNMFKAPWPYLNQKGVLHVMEAIESIPGLVVFLCDKPVTFTLPPYTLHSVLTFELSVHSGVRICSTIWMDGFQLVGRVIEEHLKEEESEEEESEEEEGRREKGELVHALIGEIYTCGARLRSLMRD